MTEGFNRLSLSRRLAVAFVVATAVIALGALALRVVFHADAGVAMAFVAVVATICLVVGLGGTNVLSRDAVASEGQSRSEEFPFSLGAATPEAPHEAAAPEAPREAPAPQPPPEAAAPQPPAEAAAPQARDQAESDELEPAHRAPAAASEPQTRSLTDGVVLVAIGYPDPGTAEQAMEAVHQLQSDLIIQAEQVAAISRDFEGNYHVRTSHGGASAGAGAWWGGFWGFLFGLLFFIPFAGLALGAGMGALFGHFARSGIDKAFQEQVRDYVKPGTSALFMVIEHATPERAIAALQQYGGTVIRTSLADEDARILRDALQPEHTPVGG